MTEQNAAQPYRVLARKYRPTTFAELIGQDALVRTLTNAIESGRLAHAFLLTGVRGIGKTSTARIIARALNCTGPDGTGGPTPTPCGVCENCRMIAEDRHVDVIEMDAASHTGVGDIREIIDAVRYRPVSARFKIYIIDEVHMLSTSAFNALLKTLEEPPEHVKFIFATTELRKVPVTVLSRCQRFDLKRVEPEVLARHFTEIAVKEQADIDAAAIKLIARAADGSVRDGLSLLDQAISHGGGHVDEAQVRDMLGLADRAQTLDLLDAVLSGAVERALEISDNLHRHGADPAVVIQDMLELVHGLSRVKTAGGADAGDGPAIAEVDRVRGREMAGKLSVPHLARAWQMLLKGLGEVRQAPSPQAAAEMILIRLAYSANLPTPGEAIARLGAGKAADGGAQAGQPQAAPSSSTGGGPPPRPSGAVGRAAPTPTADTRRPIDDVPPAASGPEAAPSAPKPAPAKADGDDSPADGGGLEEGPPSWVSEPVPDGAAQAVSAAPEPPASPVEPSRKREAAREDGGEDLDAPLVAEDIGRLLDDYARLVALFERHREGLLHADLMQSTRVAALERDGDGGVVEIKIENAMNGDLTANIRRKLEEWTGGAWQVRKAAQSPAPTLQEYADMKRARRIARARRHPLVSELLSVFEDASVRDVRAIAAEDAACEHGSQEVGGEQKAEPAAN